MRHPTRSTRRPLTGVNIGRRELLRRGIAMSSLIFITRLQGPEHDPLTQKASDAVLQVSPLDGSALKETIKRIRSDSSVQLLWNYLSEAKFIPDVGMANGAAIRESKSAGGREGFLITVPSVSSMLQTGVM